MIDVVYEDPWVQVIAPSKAAAPGHVQVISKLPVTSLEELDDAQIEHFFFVASYAGTAIFELLGAQGTNMLLTESDGPLVIDIVARRQDDGLNLLWSPTQPQQSILESSAKAIRDAIDIAKWHEEQANKKVEVVTTEDKPVVQESKDKVNYLLRHFRRHP